MSRVLVRLKKQTTVSYIYHSIQGLPKEHLGSRIDAALREENPGFPKEEGVCGNMDPGSSSPVWGRLLT
jgi:hypothetical protein